MKRTKKQAKAKEPVRLRFKQLSNGNQSIYLDLYRDGMRQYEFLKLYIVPESTPFDKMQNAQTMAAANAIKAQRIIELANGAAGIKNINKSKLLLVDWFDIHYKSIENLNESTKRLTRMMFGLVKEYGCEKLRLCDVDKAYCKGFIDFLKNTYKKKNGQPLSVQSMEGYFIRFNYALNEAVRNGLIEKNPFRNLSAAEKIKSVKSTRTYLTVEEVQRLIDTECSRENIKRAFLFSCFSGLRYSDVRLLKWGDLKKEGGNMKLALVQKKTKELLYLNLSEEAVAWLPAKKADNESIFDLQVISWVDKTVARWSMEAGIKKHVTFHTARHTFATMLLTLGADLYTVSKLLGHTNIQTTQIYAKIIDQKKQDAVNLVNGVFNH